MSSRHEAVAKSNGRSVLHRIAVLLLLSGLSYYCYGLYTGAGLSGWLMRWQLESKGSLVVGLWEAISFGVLIILPLILVTNTEKAPSGVRPASLRPMGVFFSVVAGMLLLAGWAFWMANRGPDIQATPLQLLVDDLADPMEGPRDGMVRLVGQPQNQLGFRYVAASTTGRGSTSKAQSEWRNLVPITSQNFKPSQPIRFLLASNAYQLEPGALPTGLLLRNSLPWYLRSVLERKGLRLADPYFVVDTRPYLAYKANYDAIAAISGFLGFVLLIIFLAFFWPFKDLRQALGWPLKS